MSRILNHAAIEQIKQAFADFIEDAKAFQDAVDKSTKASWGGSGYSVELLPDGSYRLLWNNQIGNLYDSPGIIVPIPALSDEEWSSDHSIRYYDNAARDILDDFEEILASFLS